MKKILTSLIAAAVTLTTAVASVAAAAGYNPNKDPNGDGVITVADATYIYQCLMGRYKPSDLTQLDVNDNAVVSEVDAMCILMHDAGVLSTSLPETDSMNAISVFPNSRYYSVYNAKTGEYKRCYFLSVMNDSDSILQDEINSSNANTNGNYENKGVAKILCSEYSAGYRGTGFVIGKHTIATAAHVVYNESRIGSWQLDDILLFDADGNPTSFTPVECHVPYLHESNTSSANYDYALITVKEDLSDYMSFNLGAITNEATNLWVEMTGFPQKSGNSNNNFNDHYEEMKNGSITLPTDKIFYHSAHVVGGDSGGPVFVSETLNGKTYNTVVGINVHFVGDGGAALRITPEVLKFLAGNANIEY